MLDKKCYDLARHFLKDEPKINNPETADTLAIVIQEAIEEFINDANNLVRRASQ